MAHQRAAPADGSAGPPAPSPCPSRRRSRWRAAAVRPAPAPVSGGGSVEPPRSRGSLREDWESLPSAGRSRAATLTLLLELLAAFLCPYWQRFCLARLVTPML